MDPDLIKESDPFEKILIFSTLNPLNHSNPKLAASASADVQQNQNIVDVKNPKRQEMTK